VKEARQMNRTKLALAALGGVLVSLFGAVSPAHAYDTTWTRNTAANYAYSGVHERYVYGGSKWRDNNTWDSDEGADCSGFAAKAWAVEHATAIGTTYHPYSTYSFYYGFPYEVFKDRTVGYFVNAWTFRDSEGGPSNHMGLFRLRNSDGTWTTYEARGDKYGIVIYTRSLSTLISWNYRRTDRKNWGG
jgi:hypothetical protein